MANIITTLMKKIQQLKTKNIIKKLIGNNTIIVDDNLLGNIKLDVRGINNVVKLTNISIPSSKTRKIIYIYLFGNNNEIIIDNISISNKLKIRIGQNHSNFGEVNFSKFNIGKGTSIEDLTYYTYNSNTHCTIGEKCMFSSDITLYNTDAHPIMDLKTMDVINKVKGISIGNHCWIGQKASILKNTVIPNDCIIGYGAVVSGTNKEEHSAYAGNPAKCIKTSITWDSNGRKNGYIENAID